MDLFTRRPEASKIFEESNYGIVLRAYLFYLQQNYRYINLCGIGEDTLALPLSELYISLTLREPSSAGLSDRVITRGIAGVFNGETAEEKARVVRDEMLEWAEMMRCHRQIVVIGDPGSGKSTLLQYTALKLVNALIDDQNESLISIGLEDEVPLVPLLLPLQHMIPLVHGHSSEELIADGSTLLLRCLTTLYREKGLLNLPDDFFESLCKQGQAILLLDGLDEVASMQDREGISKSIYSILRRFAMCRCVITSRMQAYEGNVRINGVRVRAIVPLNEDQQRCFLTNWSRCVHTYSNIPILSDSRNRQAQLFARQIWQKISSDERITNLRENPLLLTIIAVISFAHHDLPGSREEIYDKFLQLVLRSSHDKVNELDQGQTVRSRVTANNVFKSRRDLLSFVAYTMHQSGHSSITTTDFDRAVAIYMEASLNTQHEAQQFAVTFRSEELKYIGVVDEAELGQYSFTHLTIQEYLAAYYIAKDEQRRTALAYECREVWWREVIMLCAGILPRKRCIVFLKQLITWRQNTTLLEQSEILELAAQTLTEIDKFKSVEQVRDIVRNKALQLLTVSSAHARVAGGRVLAIAGDPRPGIYDLPPAMVAFAGGSFILGNTTDEYNRIITMEEDHKFVDEAKSWYEDSVCNESVLIAPFEIARYPLTNGQYKWFIDADGYNHLGDWWDVSARDWLARNDTAIDGLRSWQRREHKDKPEFWDSREYGIVRPNYPVVGISWYEAVAYCRWLTEYLKDGFTYSLQSEAEWEFAARGIQRRIYPWGKAEVKKERANYNRLHHGTTAVGCFPAGATPEGLLDMAGNVWEWTRSENRPYPYDPNDGRENEIYLANKCFTFRGGGWNVLSFILRASSRNEDPPDIHCTNVGMRIVRHVSVKF